MTIEPATEARTSTTSPTMAGSPSRSRAIVAAACRATSQAFVRCFAARVSAASNAAA